LGNGTWHLAQIPDIIAQSQVMNLASCSQPDLSHFKLSDGYDRIRAAIVQGDTIMEQSEERADAWRFSGSS
jgi:hypothetical protein